LIEYDYVIKRNEETEVVTYLPDKIPKQLPNLVYIEGPNSSGKSTLLHMIALSLHGLEKKNLNPALKNKMNSLLDTSYQKVDFKIKIQNKDKTLEIISEKDDPDKSLIKVYEIKNGKKAPLSPEKFEREYNLIYDIPENPTQRLNQLTRSLKELQFDMGKKVGLLLMNTQSVINDIKQSRDPDRINTLKEQLKRATEEYQSFFEKHEENKRFIDILEKYTYCRCYVEYYDKLNKVNNNIKKLEKKQKSKDRKKRNKSKEYNELIDEAQKLINILEAKYDESTPTLKRLIPEEDDHLIKLWERINFKESLRNLEFGENFKKVLLTFKVKLFKMTKSQEDSIEEATIWSKMISILEECKIKDIEVPGAGKKISEFIISLKEASRENEELLKYISNINNLIKLLDGIEEGRNKLETEIFPKLKEIGEDKDIEWIDDENESNDELDKEIKKKDEIKILLEHYLRECAKKDISVNDIPKVFDEISGLEEIFTYESYLEEQLLEKIRDFQNSIRDEKDALNKKYNNLGHLDNEIERMEKKEPHKYQNKLKELTDLLRICQILQQKLSVKYDKYIDEIIKGKYDNDSKDQEREKYLELVSRYLGKRIGYIRHINKEYELKSIDMMKGTIHTEEGRIIRLADMGTGQGQNAYLMGLLNISDNRKIIALFDEVAMMDNKALFPIFTKLKELYEKDKLLLGIIVQMGNEMKIEEIEG